MYNGLNFSSVTSGGLSLIKVLNGISKGLGIVKEIMPIYKEFSPLIKKVPTIFEKLSSVQASIKETHSFMEKKREDISVFSENIQTNLSKNSPTFFQ